MLDAESRVSESSRGAAPIARAAALLGLCLLTVLLLAGPARAAWDHVPGPTFQLQTMTGVQPGDIAVDERTGSVYVMGRGGGGGSTGDIEKFDAAGNKSNFSGLGTNVIETPCDNACLQVAVDNSGGPNQGTIYVSTATSLTTCCAEGKIPNPNGGVEVYAPTGLPISIIYTRSQSQLDVQACGVAVDEDGNLIVAHGEGSTPYNYIDRLEVQDWAAHPDQEPPFTETIDSNVLQNCKVAIDSAGTVYAQSGTSTGSTGQATKFPAGSFGTPWPTGEAIPVSQLKEGTVVDALGGADLFTDNEDFLYTTGVFPPQVRKFDAAGSLIETIGAGELLEPNGVAMNSATNTLYVTDSSFEPGAEDVHIFTTVKVPDSLTGAYEATTQTSGELTGEAEGLGAGQVTECEFEWTTRASFSSSGFEGSTATPCAPAAPYGENETKEVSAAIAGLSLEQPYVVRLVTKNANGTSNGTVRDFVPHAVIGLKTEPADDVAPRSATLNASFIGNGDTTEYSFEYGKNANYGTETAAGTLPSPSGPTDVSIPVQNLELETTYHYRAVATNSDGISKAFDGTFTTPPAVPGVTTQAASEIGQQGVSLSGEFTGDGNATSYYYEYGPTAEYGLTSDPTDAGSPTGVTQAPAVINRFAGYTTYHYRLVAENQFGKSVGRDKTFATPDAPLPAVRNAAVSNLTQRTASLTAEVNPNRWPTICLFEWGPTTQYGTATPMTNTIGGLDNEFHSVSGEIGELTPGTLYHYRAVAINLTGVADGPDQTFFTPDAPKIEAASSSAIGPTTAHLSATVASNGTPTGVRFEYGTTTAYGSTTAATAIGADRFSVPVEADVAGLQPGTTYHYRAVGSNGYGTSNGLDLTFSTQPVASGPGPNESVIRCPKGKVKRHGRCVKPHRKKPNKKKPGKKGQGKRHG